MASLINKEKECLNRHPIERALRNRNGCVVHCFERCFQGCFLTFCQSKWPRSAYPAQGTGWIANNAFSRSEQMTKIFSRIPVTELTQAFSHFYVLSFQKQCNILTKSKPQFAGYEHQPRLKTNVGKPACGTSRKTTARLHRGFRPSGVKPAVLSIKTTARFSRACAHFCSIRISILHIYHPFT